MLSENKTLHRYGETPGEFLANTIRDFVDALDEVGKSPANFEKVRLEYYIQVKARGSKYTGIMCAVPLLKSLASIWDLSDYYITTKFFMPNWLDSHVLGDFAGGSTIFFLSRSNAYQPFVSAAHRTRRHEKHGSPALRELEVRRGLPDLQGGQRSGVQHRTQRAAQR